MPAPFRYGRPVTVVRGDGYDELGDPTGPTSVHVIEGCSWAPRTQGAGPSTSTIDRRGRQGVIEGLTLYAPPGADVRHTDQVIIGARVPLEHVDDHDLWAVDGEAGTWDNPMSGRRHGLEIAIRRVAG